MNCDFVCESLALIAIVQCALLCNLHEAFTQLGVHVRSNRPKAFTQEFMGVCFQVAIGRPKTVDQMQKLVSEYDHVQAVGVGHSWWKEQFCAGDDRQSINIVTTEMEDTSLM